jgi:septal ring factor EnvC (AmiA/AmiB activator)
MPAVMPEEPTPGQTGIILQNIYETLQEVKKTMATRDFVDGKFGSFNDRVTRLEDDMKKLGEEHSRNTQELKDMITDRVNQVIADFDEEKDELNRRIDDIIVSKQDLEKQRKARTIGVYMAIFGATLSLIVSVVTALIVNSINP